MYVYICTYIYILHVTEIINRISFCGEWICRLNLNLDKQKSLIFSMEETGIRKEFLKRYAFI